MKSHGWGGFTLIELLVVVAIIAILASLVLPALASATSKARRVECLNKCRGWGMAMRMYADDHEDELPRENGANGINRWNIVSAVTNADVWYNALPHYLGGGRAAADYAVSVDSQAEFYAPASPFTCPAARFDDLDAAEYPNFSIGMNSRLRIGSSAPRFSRVEASPNTPLFLDAGVPGELPLAGQAVGAYDGRPHVKWDRASARHGGFGNLVFGDGSVRQVPSQVLTHPAPSGHLTWEVD